MGDDVDIHEAFLMLFIYIVLPLLLLGGTWLTEHLIIRSRRKYLSEQEAYFRERVQMTNLKQFPGGSFGVPVMVTGAAVIANNYFVSFIAGFKHLFGGEMKGYSGMCSDARRLALVRMLQEAEKIGADAVCNVRFETATITSGDDKQKSGGVELLVYGTAYRRNIS